MEQLNINTDNIYNSFNSHFNIENNSRILFTGRFGTGKTTFLDSFFEHNNDFNVFRLYPVSYSVSPNDDVFELIRYDILFQLWESCSDNLLLKKGKESLLLGDQIKFVKSIKWTPILMNLLGLLDKTGNIKSVESIITEVKAQYDDFQAQLKEGDEEKMFKFFITLYSKSGNCRERDLITELIIDLLKRLSEKTGKKNILIIDDLDRLDPEHIFRLFNIFSVNFGKEQTLNKFNFDKIIFVCDIDNIRKIYYHFYGKNVDFEGYIDKFYSISPFRFNMNQILISYTSEVINRLKLYYYLSRYGDNAIHRVLFAIFKILMYENKINLRTILKSSSINIDSNVVVFLPNGDYNVISNSPILLILEGLKSLFESSDEMHNVFASLRHYNQFNFTSNKDINISIKESREFIDLMNLCLPILVDYDELEMQNQGLNPADIEQDIEGIGKVKFSISEKYMGRIDIQYKGFCKLDGKKGIINPFRLLELVNAKGVYKREME